MVMRWTWIWLNLLRLYNLKKNCFQTERKEKMKTQKYITIELVDGMTKVK